MGATCMMSCRSGLSALALLGLMATAALAEALPEPDGTVILTVTGSIERTNGDGTARFDLAMLQAMDPVAIETTTIWTEGVQSFRGVPLSRLLAALEAKGEVIAASALNDYMVEIPLADAVEGGPILAFEQNGRLLSVRDKGPLWVVYPYDSVPQYQTETVYVRSIWQLARLEIR